MDNPFQLIAAAFEHDYRVNFRIERLDGSVSLTLSDDTGIKVKRLISKQQLHDRTRLARLIDSIRLGMAIDAGQGVTALLANGCSTANRLSVAN
ncbi:DUF3509 domain-containing protein [Pseudomonas oryzihabitans]|uniref:DUF3509 domain-containing protein n=1 Tax=Pseudomonas oryzihabitans TaxID=47885 RepID=UPI00289563B8|nr:DUF3509 domain-containing protein [Pseudomonas oryzihabitans]MDT3720465.1 DUF3509 domain-containing protein [Pseudomonas oryzihabitans]